MATASLADLLTHPDWRLPATVVGPDPFRRVADAASYLPASAIDGVILECRLRRGDSRVDLALSIDRLAEAAPAIDRVAREVAPARDRSTWARIVELMRVWPDVFWFEFDLDVERVTELPLPSMFFRLPFESVDGQKVLVADAPAHAVEGLDRLLGTPLAPAVRTNVIACLTSAPPGVRIHQVGAMLPRGGGRVRLCFYAPSLETAAVFCDQHGCSAEWAAVHAVLAPLQFGPAMILVNFDVAEDVRRKVGIEVYPRAMPRDVAWRRLLEGLVEAGLCDPGKGADLPGWNGCSVNGAVAAHDGVNLLKRELRHVKIVAEPGMPLEAKVYLGLTVTPIRARQAGN